MSELYRCSGEVDAVDSKTFRSFTIDVPPGLAELQVTLDYERGRLTPHNLIVLALYDPNGFRGIAHRFATRQVIRLGDKSATPGFVPGAIPAGEWTLELSMFWIMPTVGGRRWTYSILVETHKPTLALQNKTSDLAHHGRWFKGDLHAHSYHSDGAWSLQELAETARTYGLDFIALTDHNTISGLAEISAAAQANDLLIIPGMELTTFHGHAVSLAVNPWVDWRTGHNQRTINTAAVEVRAVGGVFVVVHPDAPRDEICTGCGWAYPDFDPRLAHAVQVWGGSHWNHPEEHNAGCLQFWKDWLNQGYQLTALGGTDAHGPDGWGDNSGWTYVWADERSVEAILASVRAGHTFVSSGPQLNITAQNKELAASNGQTVRVVWSACPEVELRIIVNGETRQSKRVAGSGELEVTLLPLDRWSCAELWDPRGDTLLAVTSAVYPGANDGDVKASKAD